MPPQFWAPSPSAPSQQTRPLATPPRDTPGPRPSWTRPTPDGRARRRQAAAGRRRRRGPVQPVRQGRLHQAPRRAGPRSHRRGRRVAAQARRPAHENRGRRPAGLRAAVSFCGGSARDAGRHRLGRALGARHADADTASQNGRPKHVRTPGGRDDLRLDFCLSPLDARSPPHSSRRAPSSEATMTDLLPATAARRRRVIRPHGS